MTNAAGPGAKAGYRPVKTDSLWETTLDNLAGQKIVVLGAGIVGVCVALELQARGGQVTLVDRAEPGSETSFGNAGVISRSSLVPLNNPTLWSKLPRLLTNRTCALRYSLPFILRNPGWAISFLANARREAFNKTATALDALIRLSAPLHLDLLAAAKETGRLNDTGWFFLYRRDADFQKSALALNIYQQFGVQAEILDAPTLQQHEPGLKPIFARAVWVKDCYSVNAPGAVVRAYADLFAARGGEIRKADIREVAKDGDSWRVVTDSSTLSADKVVVALGPWSRKLLESSGMRVPMGYERGYHMHYSGAASGPHPSLTRPVFDVSGGYVLSPMAEGLRLTTGVELTEIDAAPNHAQLNMAEAAAYQAIELGERLDPQPWLGHRPTMPDSRPVIGEAPNRRGLFLAFGHQHIGFSTAPGTARILADLMERKATEIPAAPFAPERFIR
ncbi:FAD-binding oxidoreductase [Paracoccus sp. SCSIO 75233]|uniref:NAD(P)/FAD-dependent oxidoreductase n=1 Tax=Paracoccus sp. SCSIO 75233 TaxID=3017782 RepID=UPI0022EFFFF6|nr:FAD-binding oxidoreductase [Paracoccus sp. SCSIO 75233]WBU54454.1 FAD-binding oxidoreductase [Paracoccus sp. SCSIO 75233]